MQLDRRHIRHNHQPSRVAAGSISSANRQLKSSPVAAAALTSRQIFLRFFLDARMENFLRGQVPHTHVQRILTVLADPDRLRIVEGQGDRRQPSTQLR